jgi:PD-(D/E)XK nuclease superfamily protein
MYISVMLSKDDKGQIAESGFVFIAMLNHLVVWKPVNPQLKYDFVVEGAVRQFKVQVKCAWREGNSHRVGLTKQRRSSLGLTRKTYSTGDFDVLAVFNMDEREFWLFPASIALRRSTIWCRTSRAQCPHDFDTSSFWKSWQIFDGV